ncbi:MAG TPA: hypothetical protein VGZ91_02445 [Candidatus Sulfotelmatobacter sp.]|jgi:hypothetical protein|nr:hypothetical protein [Candidatus Sulfotelmatobacter sp.]
MPTPHSSTLDSTNRQPSNLNDRLNRRLLAYVATAGAAGVSVLAMTQPATAKVVYTPADKTVLFDGMHLDLNNDGIPDFGFHSYGIGNVGSGVVFPIKFNKMMNHAQPLASGVSVGPGGSFRGGRQEMVGACFCSGIWDYFGPWVGVQNEYMGLEFNIKGAAHFGWARFSATDTGTVTLTGYAYETISLKPIVTGDTGSNNDDEDSVEQKEPAAASPQPSGLGKLALGVQGRAAR